ncbi:MAG: hypothetical protein WA240_01105 [Nitrospirota bacterium]
MKKDIKIIAEEINNAAANYKMRDFQEIRRRIQGRPRTLKIFTDSTIHIAKKDNDKDYAFHDGGRTELQFNIGFEDKQKKQFRYGIAFSLERTKTLKDPMMILKPKIKKLNDYIIENQSELKDIRFWFWYPTGRQHQKQRSATLPVAPVSENLISIGNFLFWGKMSPTDSIQPEEILFLFDRLLHIYEFVEGNVRLEKHPAELNKGFQFKAGCSDKMETAIHRSQATTKAVMLHHNKLQAALHSILSQKYGEDNVGTENDTGRGSRVDLVVRDGNKHRYYEIKTSPSIRDCLRDAIAQLIEYSYWPGGNEAGALIVVSENPLTPDARCYLRMLRERFHLPIFYQHLDLKEGNLEEPE